MKQLMKGYVYYVEYPGICDPLLTWSQSATMGQGDPDWTLVGPHNFEVECPDDFDPRPHQIAALREKERQVRADFAKSITDIQAQIQSLLALEMA